MSLILIALLVARPTSQSDVASASMKADVERLVRAAEQLTGTWPSQPPPAIPEVALVARHGKSVVPLLTALLSDEPNAERDQKRWKVQQQVSLALCRIYSESTHCDLKDARGVPLLIPLLSDKDVNWIVPWSLGEIGDPGAVEPLVRVLEQDDPSMRVLAIYALEKLNARAALPKLRELLQDNRKSNFGDGTTVAEAAKRAIDTISGTEQRSERYEDEEESTKGSRRGGLQTNQREDCRVG